MKRLQKGFTIIELLVSISVIAIISGIGFASFTQFNRKQQVTNTVMMILSDLRLAQSKAQSSEIPPDTPTPPCETPFCATICHGNPLVGYKVEFAADNLSYSIKAVCPPNTPSPIKTVTLPGGIVRVSGFSSVTFKPLQAGIQFVGVNKLVISATYDASLTKTINISSGGEINITDN